MSGYFYWGGKMDYEKELKNAGYKVYTVSVGPISTNRDRAIEAFYQIKGGQLDYGFNASIGPDRIQKPKNKNFPGLYPKWNSENPVHIIAHSQGGQTARELERLLKYKNNNELSPLLSNNYLGWIKSITTISTPHNGSTLVPIMMDMFPFIINMAPWFGSIYNDIIENFYNFDLDHWGLKKYNDESLNDFWVRIFSSPLINTKNLCVWDLSIDGSKEFNEIYVEDNNVYYFTFTTSSTSPTKKNKKHKPNQNMSIHLWPTSMLMGGYENAPGPGWFENDGIVNSISMSHPHDVQSIKLEQHPIKGVWQRMDSLYMDHQAIIGHGVSQKENNDILVLYKNHCNMLWDLE